MVKSKSELSTLHWHNMLQGSHFTLLPMVESEAAHEAVPDGMQNSRHPAQHAEDDVEHNVQLEVGAAVEGDCGWRQEEAEKQFNEHPNGETTVVVDVLALHPIGTHCGLLVSVDDWGRWWRHINGGMEAGLLLVHHFWVWAPLDVDWQLHLLGLNLVLAAGEKAGEHKNGRNSWRE